MESCARSDCAACQGVRGRRAGRFLILAALVLSAGAGLRATDYPEPLAIDDPLWRAGGPEPAGAAGAPEFLPGGYAELGYNWHALAWSPTDIWNLHASLAFMPLRIGDVFACSLYYSAWTLAMPYAAGDQAVNIVRLWLGALEFEYGLTAAVALGPCHLTAEYSRTSLHDLKGVYSAVSTDDLKIGLILPDLVLGDWRTALWLRGGVVDLFDFWQSILPKPRLAGIVSIGAETEWRLAGWLAVFDRGGVDGNFLRGGGFDLGWWNELGLSLGEGAGRMDVYLELSGTPDSEEVAGRASPAFLAGLGIRLRTQP